MSGATARHHEKVLDVNPSPGPEVITQIYSKQEKCFIQIPADPYALMNEVAAAAFCNLTRRAIQNFRLTGEGPKFVRISSRCIKYRKVDLIAYQEERLRSSTSDQGEDLSCA